MAEHTPAPRSTDRGKERLTARRIGFPSHQYTNGVGIAQSEIQTGWPASSIKEWIEDGVRHTNDNGTISSTGVNRFRAEHANLLP